MHKSTQVPAAAATIAAVMTSDMVMTSSLTVETATCTVAEAELQGTSTTLNTVEVPLTESGLSSSYTPEMPGSADLPTSSDNSGGVATVSVADAQADVAAAQVASSNTPSCSKRRFSLTNISPVPLPVPLRGEGKRKTKQKKSEILTASPMEPMLEDKKAKQEKERRTKLNRMSESKS